jgi:hypothetical protein
MTAIQFVAGFPITLDPVQRDHGDHQAAAAEAMVH